ncbi:MAG: pyridoxamine 5'-phosphate oxidase family protein [Oscillospiraceae bacterium]|nr:pyridoxamine 5'-phosphate oxidase family protein [Oscillospiraceae bacterium]
MKRVYDFLDKCGTYYLATEDGDQPRVRPFGTIDMYNGKLYIQTGKSKAVSKQLSVNPKVEISAFDNSTGSWIRIAAALVNDDSVDAKRHMLEKCPDLKASYSEDDDNTQVLYLTNAVATISSFFSEPEVIRF